MFVDRRWAWWPGRRHHRPVYSSALVAFVGFSSGASRPAVGWVPLAPCEVYRPHHRASHTYIRNVNVTTVNQTTINNITVDNLQAASANSFRNRSAATAVSEQTFRNARPVHNATFTVPTERIEQRNADDMERIRPERRGPSSRDNGRQPDRSLQPSAAVPTTPALSAAVLQRQDGDNRARPEHRDDTPRTASPPPAPAQTPAPRPQAQPQAQPQTQPQARTQVQPQEQRQPAVRPDFNRQEFERRQAERENQRREAEQRDQVRGEVARRAAAQDNQRREALQRDTERRSGEQRQQMEQRRREQDQARQQQVTRPQGLAAPRPQASAPRPQGSFQNQHPSADAQQPQQQREQREQRRRRDNDGNSRRRGQQDQTP